MNTHAHLDICDTATVCAGMYKGHISVSQRHRNRSHRFKTVETNYKNSYIFTHINSYIFTHMDMSYTFTHIDSYIFTHMDKSY